MASVDYQEMETSTKIFLWTDSIRGPIKWIPFRATWFIFCSAPYIWPLEQSKCDRHRDLVVLAGHQVNDVMTVTV